MSENKVGFETLDRRSLLKSAGMALLASSYSAGSGAQSSTTKGQISHSAAATRGLRKGMVGFQLAYEQFPVDELVQLGVEVEQAGFDVLTNSDHLQPWQANEGHSGQAWLTHERHRFPYPPNLDRHD